MDIYIKTHLILEGGGMRGVYTTGVLDFFLDKSLYFHNITGVSAGACHATSYISKQRGRSLEIVLTYAQDKRYIDKMGVLKSGSIFGMDFIFHEIPDKLLPFDYDAYFESKANFHAVVTDCNTGGARYLPCGNILTTNDYVMASSSLPMVSHIVNIDGMELLDGGVADSIPIGYSLREGYEKHVLILTRTAGYRKPPNQMAWAARAKYAQYPKLCDAIEKRHIEYNRSLDLAEKLESEGSAFIIRPSGPVDIGRAETNSQKLKDLYDMGYNDGKNAYDKLITFLQSEN